MNLLQISTCCLRIAVAMALLALAACVSGGQGTLASLKDVKPDVKEEKIEGSLEKALQSYQRFLEETPETAMTPEAIRRLADLKIEKEYSVSSKPSPPVIDLPEDTAETEAASLASAPAAEVEAPKPASGPIKPVTTAQSGKMDAPMVPIVDRKQAAAITDDNKEQASKKSSAIADLTEPEKEFSKRATHEEKLPAKATAPVSPTGRAEDLQVAGAMEAIDLYKGLLEKYPLYDRNDEVMYQLSRAYEETGQIEKAIDTLNVLVVKYPNSRHIDEAQFRRAEYFFSHKRYLDAEEAYQVVLNIGRGSAFYELSLYKQGWSFFKQELYDEALKDYIKMLDHKIDEGVDLAQVKNKIEKKRIDDTYRVISLSFSYLGGPESIVEFFNQTGPREYEANIYSNLGEYYLEKRRYNDAAQTYNSFIGRNPLHKESPYFNIRVIEIYLKGGFPKLVIEAKKNFSIAYGLNASYWQFFDIKTFPVVLAYLKSNLADLATHYHALFQDKRLVKQKQENYLESIRWYREFLASFPEDEQAPVLNFQLAGLMLENHDFRGAALEYERTAYNYPPHEKSAEAGYAAVFAYREYFKAAQASDRILVRREIIRSSLKFAETFPDHKNAAVVLAAAADDLYELKDYPLAVKTGRRLIEIYPQADPKLVRSAWLVVAHASFDQTYYSEAEPAYVQVLAMTDAKDPSREKLIENLAAAIYKQGEQASKLEKYREAANHFLRMATATPTASIRSNAEFDASAALITLKDWPAAARVLEDFRKRYPKHKLQPEITRKLAVVYKEDGKLLQAAAEFERIETETDNDELKREALLQSAELYEQAKAMDAALRVYHRFVAAFPRPLEFALETRNKMANIYQSLGNNAKYLEQLTIIVDADRKAGSERTDRTRYLAAEAALVLAEPTLKSFYEVRLVKPFKKNLDKKNKRMKLAIDTYGKLIDYQVGNVTAAATFQLAEIYYHFSRALMDSERPDGLSELELEQYNLVIEEQAYPFEEKAIAVHEKNMELLGVGIYNSWIDRSIAKLAVLLPARYAKPEETNAYVENLVPVSEQAKPAVPDRPAQEAPAPETPVDPVPKADTAAALSGSAQ
jgi:tetratricopeptide (TPR) repeat protein